MFTIIITMTIKLFESANLFQIGGISKEKMNIISVPTGGIMKIFIPNLIYVRGVFFGFWESLPKQCQLNTLGYFSPKFKGMFYISSMNRVTVTC